VSAIGLLLAKDARRLARSPLLLAALVVYPLLIALLLGLVVRYAQERPRVALVDEAGLPATIQLGERRFDLRGLFEDAAEVDLVRMTADRARRELATGQVVASLTIPRDFTVKLRRLNESPRMTLRTSQGVVGTRVVEKMRALTYGINLTLQKAYIDANLGYVDLLKRGGTGKLGETQVTVIGLEQARRELERLAGSGDPEVAAAAKELARFVGQVGGAVDQVAAYLQATASPVELVSEEEGGRTWLLSAQVQSYALGLALAFVAVLLGAASITGEREERTLGRLVRGLVSPGRLVAEKVVFVAAIGAFIGVLLAVVFGAVVELGSVTGGQPWERLPLLAVGLALAAAAFGALGTLLGTLARDASGAMLLALLVGLPVVLLGVVPAGSFALADTLASLAPFGHAVDLATAALYDADPWRTSLREGAWLLGLTVAFALASRLTFRRLLL
jgi:ABC-type transport system involved in multi-copper enzyme maturation permease subunit